MLIASYFLVLFFGILAGLWIAARGGSLEQHASAVLPHSPAEVFSYLHQPEKLKTWLTGFESSEPLSDGPVAVGSRYKTTLNITSHYKNREVSRRVMIEVEILEFDPGKKLRIKQRNSVIDSEVDYELLPFNGGTFLKMNAVTVYKGPLRLIVHFERRGAQERAEKDMLALEKAMSRVCF